MTMTTKAYEVDRQDLVRAPRPGTGAVLPARGPVRRTPGPCTPPPVPGRTAVTAPDIGPGVTTGGSAGVRPEPHHPDTP
ncbi:hypothetical protein [Streptomyces sp. NPDC014685]|uniref:hypothetical protein n=1 Tax=Streptomyces sp. NPDC014685 TaxID=3364881 RepID=UPI0036F64689